MRINTRILQSYGVCNRSYGATVYTMSVIYNKISVSYGQLRCNRINVSGVIGFSITATAVEGFFTEVVLTID